MMDKVNGKMTGKENIVKSETHQGDYQKTVLISRKNTKPSTGQTAKNLRKIQKTTSLLKKIIEFINNQKQNKTKISHNN